MPIWTRLVAGAFLILVAWNHGVDYQIEKFDDYWGAEPHLENVTFSFVGAADARTTGVESGTLDAALIPASQVPVVENSAAVQVTDALPALSVTTR